MAYPPAAVSAVGRGRGHDGVDGQRGCRLQDGHAADGPTGRGTDDRARPADHRGRARGGDTDHRHHSGRGDRQRAADRDRQRALVLARAEGGRAVAARRSALRRDRLPAHQPGPRRARRRACSRSRPATASTSRSCRRCRAERRAQPSRPRCRARPNSSRCARSRSRSICSGVAPSTSRMSSTKASATSPSPE